MINLTQVKRNKCNISPNLCKSRHTLLKSVGNAQVIPRRKP